MIVNVRTKIPAERGPDYNAKIEFNFQSYSCEFLHIKQQGTVEELQENKQNIESKLIDIEARYKRLDTEEFTTKIKVF